MQIDEQRQGAVTVIRPSGPLVADDALALKAHLSDVLRRTLGRFVIDASQIAFCDSAGLETLVEITEEMASGGRSLQLCGVTETLREVLDLTDLSGQFEYAADVNTAVRSFM